MVLPLYKGDNWPITDLDLNRFSKREYIACVVETDGYIYPLLQR